LAKHTIAFVNTFAQVSGANISLLVLLKHLDSSHFKPIVYLPPREARPIYEDFRIQGIPVELVPMERPSWKTVSWENFRYVASLLPTAWKLRKRFRNQEIELVVLNGIWNLQGALAALSLRVPIVWWIREEHFPGWVIRILAKIIEVMAEQTVAISESLRERFYGQKEIKRLNVIYNGVECVEGHRFTPVSREELGLRAGDRVIGCVGPLYPPKGQIHLIRAAARIVSQRHRVVLLLVGGELERQLGYSQQVRQEIQAFGLEKHVRLLGFRKDIPALLEHVDIYVQPSISEGFGRAVVEAMWDGCPVVASAVGGLREIVVQGETGLLVPPADSQALARALLTLLDDGEVCRRMGAAGKQRVLDLFDIRKISQQAARVLLHALGRGHIVNPDD